MFKAPIKMLHPLLTATQEGNLYQAPLITDSPIIEKT
jgi:predicted Ser/Thr protein kinase